MARKGRPTAHANDDGSPPDVPIDATAIVLGMAGTPRWKDELTRELLEQLVACSRIGGFRTQTALACSVQPAILEGWLSEGMRADGPELERELSVRFQSGRNGLGLVLVGIISRAAQMGDWEAAMALLEKMDPAWAGKTQDADLSPPELSGAQRKQMLIAALKEPKGDLREALLAAGLITAEPVPVETAAEPPE